jgi:diaminopimelate decarboxylase
MNIQFRNNMPFFEGVSINEITHSCNTPFYIYSQKIITDTYKVLQDSLSSEIFFAVKANPNQSILKLMKNCGAGADVVSIGEMHRALNVGFHPNKIIFEGVGKSKEDIEYAVEKNIRLINVESIGELGLVNQIGKNFNKIINVGVRLNPDIDGQTLDKISTGKKTDKFGIPLHQLKNIISLMQTYNYISLKGISCHVGSQIHDISIFEKIFETMKDAAEIALSSGIELEHVDLGGGFGVNYEKDQNEININDLKKLIVKFFNDVPYKISFEPGRYLVAKSGVIITKILTTKENGGINFLITDAGMQTLIRPAMYGAQHRIEALNDISKKDVRYTVAGPICESSDILAKNIILPEQKINNYLVIYDTGAYGATMASNYNSRGIPAEVLVNESEFFIIHKEEKIFDIIKRDSIPNWL